MQPLFAATSAPTRAGNRICPLCESTCGLLFAMDGRRIVGVTPNSADIFSEGHSCAKGVGLAAIENDPSRIRKPLLRNATGRFQEVTWEKAFAVIDERLPEFVGDDPGTCAVYHGNPAAHHLDSAFYLGELLASLGTRNVYSPASVDTWPKNLAQLLLYGSGLGITVPDIDRTDYFLVLGSNPLISNGSTMTAPGMHRRLDALRARGGTLVVVDPVRTRTADIADIHVGIRPGTDALFLLALLSVISRERLFNPSRIPDVVDSVADVRAMVTEFTPELVAGPCGIDATVIYRVAREFAASTAAVAHSRIGTCLQEFGTLTNWLVEVLNVVTGNLDRPGGAMFSLPPGGGPNTWPVTKPPRLMYDRWRSRVRQLPELLGELPAACLAEEILTPGPGRSRALITIAGNPARSLPNSNAVEAALQELDFMVSLDCYVNETTRYADVILPPPPLTTRGHHDILLAHFQVRNVARYSPPLIPLVDGEFAEWQLMLRLAAAATGQGDRPIADMDAAVAAVAARRAATVTGTTTDHVLTSTAQRSGPARILDIRLRSGPYGDRFGANPGGLTLEQLENSPNGIDYGPLHPRLPGVLRTPNGRIDLAPAMIMADLPRLRSSIDRPTAGLTLVSRRQPRGMNSWLHNALRQPHSGLCALLMCSQDAAARGLLSGDRVVVRSKTTAVTAELRVDDALRPGVVSMPHGWGHTGSGMQTPHAESAPGTNYNALVDDVQLEPLTGSPIVNGISVAVSLA